MIRCQFPDCTEAAECRFTGKALVLPRVPLCGEHTKELMRACRGMGAVTLDALPGAEAVTAALLLSPAALLDAARHGAALTTGD